MALAQELATKGVTVNTVSPGYIGTDMVKAIRPDVLEKIVATVPVKRLGEPSEIASIIAWLASDEGGYATGADFRSTAGCTWVEGPPAAQIGAAFGRPFHGCRPWKAKTRKRAFARKACRCLLGTCATRQKRAGARLRSRSSSGQAVKRGVCSHVENSPVMGLQRDCRPGLTTRPKKCNKG